MGELYLRSPGEEELKVMSTIQDIAGELRVSDRDHVSVHSKESGIKVKEKTHSIV